MIKISGHSTDWIFLSEIIPSFFRFVSINVSQTGLFSLGKATNVREGKTQNFEGIRLANPLYKKPTILIQKTKCRWTRTDYQFHLLGIVWNWFIVQNILIWQKYLFWIYLNVGKSDCSRLEQRSVIEFLVAEKCKLCETYWRKCMEKYISVKKKVWKRLK